MSDDPAAQELELEQAVGGESTPQDEPTSEIVKVDLPDITGRGYEIRIESGLMQRLGAVVRELLPERTRILLVTDATVGELFLKPVRESLQAAGFESVPCIVPAGEGSKSMTQALGIYELGMQHHLSRKDAVLALGGGVIGDLAGFVASTYHRGMPVIQVPTTLVAQVDSAIGGKTAVNTGKVKNAVGTFHQPLAVLSDPEVLETLPERELAAGLAEVAKYGLIEQSCLNGGMTGDEPLFDWLCAQGTDLKPHFPEMIRRCSEIKARVVSEDETETRGLRYFLNLGHTFGHAYESLSNYSLLHGEAVAIGLVKAARLSQRLGMFSNEDIQRLGVLLRALGLSGLSQQAACFAPGPLLNRMKQDKKNRAGNITLILPDGPPGRVIQRDDVPDEEILKVLEGS